MADQVVLYDFAQRTSPNKCWSYNVLKIRLALNYKKVPYTTVWVDHNTIGPTIKALGVAPHTSSPVFEYTVPTVKFPDGSVVTNSADIAAKLEELYPAPATPSLHLDAALQKEADEAVFAAAFPLFPNYVPRLMRENIIESTQPAFRGPREAKFGMTIEQFEETKGGQQAWDAAAPGFAAMKALLTEHSENSKEGPFILGKEVCYADFILAAEFQAMKRIGEDMFQKTIGVDESFARLYEASREWFEAKDD